MSILSNDYRISPVYLTQCKTFSVARRLSKTQSLVLKSDDILASTLNPPYCLRLVPSARNIIAQSFRDLVANEVRALRDQKRNIQ